MYRKYVSLKKLAVVMFTWGALAQPAAAPQIAHADFQGHPDHFLGYSWPWTPGTPGSHLPLHLKYERGCAGPYYTAAGQAAQSWQQTPTPLYFDEVPSSGSCSTAPIYGRIKIVAVDAGPEFTGRTPAYTRHYKEVCDNTLAAIATPPVANICSDHPCTPDPDPDPSCHVETFFQETRPGERIDAVVVMLNSLIINNLKNDPLHTGVDRVKAAVVHELGHALGLAHAGFYAVPSENVPAYSIMDDILNVSIPFGIPQAYDIFEVNKLYPGW